MPYITANIAGRHLSPHPYVATTEPAKPPAGENRTAAVLYVEPLPTPPRQVEEIRAHMTGLIAAIANKKLVVTEEVKGSTESRLVLSQQAAREVADLIEEICRLPTPLKLELLYELRLGPTGINRLPHELAKAHYAVVKLIARRFSQEDFELPASDGLDANIRTVAHFCRDPNLVTPDETRGRLFREVFDRISKEPHGEQRLKHFTALAVDTNSSDIPGRANILNSALLKALAPSEEPLDEEQSIRSIRGEADALSRLLEVECDSFGPAQLEGVLWNLMSRVGQVDGAAGQALRSELAARFEALVCRDEPGAAHHDASYRHRCDLRAAVARSLRGEGPMLESAIEALGQPGGQFPESSILRSRVFELCDYSARERHEGTYMYYLKGWLRRLTAIRGSRELPVNWRVWAAMELQVIPSVLHERGLEGDIRRLKVEYGFPL